METLPIDQVNEHYKREGWLHVRQVVDPERCGRLRCAAEMALAKWRLGDANTGQPGGFGDNHVMRHLTHPAYLRERPDLLIDLLELIADPQMLDIVGNTLGVEQPLFRCTSLFFNPLISSNDGNWHRDFQFGRDEKQEREFWDDHQHEADAWGMQLQIPLVPSEDSQYVPGSHLRWDTDKEYHVRRADNGKHAYGQMPEAIRVSLQPGDAVGFNSLGLHRGRYHTDKLRRTLMFSYANPNRPALQDGFSRQPWFLEEGYLDGLSDHARAFFNRFIDVHRDWWLSETEVETQEVSAR